ncbi:MAG: IclR family transcriptional regulator domain-containing protein [Planctomycetota bacterium]|jgi:DNA-binding IclR family transcriptional regulator
MLRNMRPSETKINSIEKALRMLTTFMPSTERVALLEQFKEIRRLGISFDLEEIDEGTSAIGAPIFNHEEKPVASIVIAGPSQRITANNSLEMVFTEMNLNFHFNSGLQYQRAVN